MGDGGGWLVRGRLGVGVGVGVWGRVSAWGGGHDAAQRGERKKNKREGPKGRSLCYVEIVIDEDFLEVQAHGGAVLPLLLAQAVHLDRNALWHGWL